MPQLAEWDSFYVIVGSAAGALIGLQFVVMTLIAATPALRTSAQAGAAFATPTVVHFSTVLFLSAVMRAPWHANVALTILWGLVGIGGLVYAGIVTRRMHSQSAYEPEFEDWLFHSLLPFAAYALFALSAIATSSHLRAALFGAGAAALLLLFTGIHNAWDAVAWHVLVKMRRPGDRDSVP